jgi:hypothetical protein
MCWKNAKAIDPHRIIAKQPDKQTIRWNVFSLPLRPFKMPLSFPSLLMPFRCDF